MKSSSLSRFKLTAVLVLLAARAHAAPCCGGGAAMPSLITGDDRAQLQSSVSYGSVIGDAPAEGLAIFRAEGDQELTETFRVDGAYRVSDRFQLGAGVPVTRRARAVDQASAAATGLGDIAVSGAYEALPEWSYSWWKPHGFVFLLVTLPTSPSTYDAVAPYQLDARGRGFFTLGLGTALLKTAGVWDFLLTGEGHRAFQRTVATSDGGSLTLMPGLGFSGAAGAGVSPGNGAVRFGLSLSPVWESGIRTTGDVTSQSSSQLVWNLSAQAGYMINSAWSTSLSYVDQTLLGPAHNVSLSRTVALALQKRWEL